MLEQRALESAIGGNGDLRKEGSVANADGGVGLGQRALRSRNIRTALEEMRRHTRRNRRRRVGHRLHGNGKIAGHLAQQYRNGMLILRARQPDVGRRRPRSLESRPRFDDRNVIAGAGVVRALVGVERLLVGVHRLVQDLLQHVLPANLKVVLGQRGLLGQLLVLQIGRTHLCGVFRLMHLVANLAPQVRNPGDFERRRPERTGPPHIGLSRILKIAGRFRSVPGGVRRDRRPVLRSRLGNQRSRLHILLKVLLDVLVVDVQLVFERI